ncbi:MAG: LptF/LptG family permease, partial [Gemmatimonadaceae bacterium]
GRPTAPGNRSMTIGELRDAARHVDVGYGDVARSRARSRAALLEVEIQKKFALPVACLALALAGIALAFRMPRGGMGLVIVASLTFFGAYYNLIMTGEDLAVRLVVSPVVGVWAGNAFVLMVSLLALLRRREPLVPAGQEAVVVRG